jgi:hypothetical protein
MIFFTEGIAISPPVGLWPLTYMTSRLLDAAITPKPTLWIIGSFVAHSLFSYRFNYLAGSRDSFSSLQSFESRAEYFRKTLKDRGEKEDSFIVKIADEVDHFWYSNF